MHSKNVLVLCLRVVSSHLSNWLDLPELESIEAGYQALRFNEDDYSTELIMRSDGMSVN